MRGQGLMALAGTGLVADDLHLMAHHEVTGRPYLHARATGLGLAGALLAELTLTGNIGIADGVVVVTNRTQPEDGLARAVLSVLIGDGRRHVIQDWLAFLARTSAQDVACRLERAGYLAQAAPRRGRRATGWVPVDADSAFAPLIRVRAALDPSRWSDDANAVLAGLAAACGLGSRLLPYGPPHARRCLDDTIRQLSPDLRQLIAQTQAAVDTAVLSHRP